MAEKMIPDIALKYIKNKTLKPAFSYKDVWNEEHATAFTVAKAMQIDILSDIKSAVEKAIGEGQSFERFKKELKPALIKKGWWGRREMNDPLTGKTVNARLGSDSRLRTIYRTNLRSAYQKGQYERTMESDAHPYMMYCVGASVRHREQTSRGTGSSCRRTTRGGTRTFPRTAGAASATRGRCLKAARNATSATESRPRRGLTELEAAESPPRPSDRKRPTGHSATSARAHSSAFPKA